MTMLGKWITNGTASPFYARKEFSIDKEISSAEAKVCGLGQFLFYVNGRKAGDHELDPGWTNYNRKIQYVTFDVTDMLHTGENVIGAEVGNGWFIKTDEHYTFSFPAFMPPNPNPYRPFGKYLVFAAELRITYRDGSEDIITADDSFQVKSHPVVMSNVYGSETIDGRLAQKGWASAGFKADGWEQAVVLDEREEPAGELMEQLHPAVKVIRTYDARFLRGVWKETGEESGKTDNNGKKDLCGGSGGAGKSASRKILREIFDFGQNMSGILEMELFGKKGDMIRIYPAEKLGPDGDVDQVAKNWVNLDSCITFIVGEDDFWENFRMKFTYFAGRYAAVEKYGSVQVRFRNFKAHAITSAWKTDGSFSCDDLRYEQIYSLVEKAVEANMLGVHTDCPTIERFAWQEPNHLMAPSIMYMKDGRKLWEKFLLDMRTDQHTAEDYFLDFDGNKVYPGDGLMPSQCPCYIPNVLPVPGMGSFYDIIPWGSTCILGTWWHYQFYGDERIIRDNYQAGMRYLNHLKRKITKDGFINHGLGDWGNPENHLLRENVETAFLYGDAVTLERFARILGRDGDARELGEFAESVKNNYNEKLLVYHEEKGFWCYRAWDHPGEIFLTQASQALPLYWGLVPADKEEDVVKAFRMTLEEKEAFVSGEVGLPYIIQTAGRYGMDDLIARFILRETHPGYYAFVLDGETTLGEYWETNPRSHCHDMMGHIVEWYYNGIAGIRPLEPGFSRVEIRPYLPETIHEFTCGYDSAAGRIQVHVKEEKTEILLEVLTDERIRCEVNTEKLNRDGKTCRIVSGHGK